MILLDSNIVIYLRDAKFGELILKQIYSSRLHTCNVIIAEVLGYKGIEDIDAYYFKEFFASMKNDLLDEQVTDKVIALRRVIVIKLPDAIIAATALIHGLELWTHNTQDYNQIGSLKLHDPIH